MFYSILYKNLSLYKGKKDLENKNFDCDLKNIGSVKITTKIRQNEFRSAFIFIYCLPIQAIFHFEKIIYFILS